jgi:hypothetical protein
LHKAYPNHVKDKDSDLDEACLKKLCDIDLGGVKLGGFQPTPRPLSRQPRTLRDQLPTPSGLGCFTERGFLSELDRWFDEECLQEYPSNAQNPILPLRGQLSELAEVLAPTKEFI